MTATLGRALILLALLASSTGAFVGFAAGFRGSVAGATLARRLAYLFAAAMAAANLLMVWALLARDFSVSYVAQVGSRHVPDWVAVTSLWSSLEGSILFWGVVLGGYVAAATWLNRDRHPEYMPHAIGTWLACGAFFSFLLAGPAQPFLTVPNPPADGPGPNPLLQNHLLMIVHPPFLYLGYVGMTIPFGLASAALLRGRLGHDFLKPMRTWLMVPWIFLTVAIVLGGWWAYEVLGWGGYWAWDPVENASFLPWLTATAAIHSAMLTERKGVLKGWTTTLVLASFLLTVLGTFMTRSGVFNSVHSFTQSAIGPTILVFLAAATIWSVLLLASRIDRLGPDGRLEGARSRDGMFLLNNLLLVLFTFTVLIGTVFPLVVEAVRDVQMSVGRPYFDRMAVPLGVALLFLMGVGPALPWGTATADQLRRALLPPLAGAGVGALVGLAVGARNPWTLLAEAGENRSPRPCGPAC
jgi:cytochrome c-type biogenesis protein CcmF